MQPPTYEVQRPRRFVAVQPPPHHHPNDNPPHHHHHAGPYRPHHHPRIGGNNNHNGPPHRPPHHRRPPAARAWLSTPPLPSPLPANLSLPAGGKECVIVWDIENVRPPMELSAHQLASLIAKVFVEAPGRRCAGIVSAVSDTSRRAIGPARFDSLATNGVLSWRFLYAPGTRAGDGHAIASGAGGEEGQHGGGGGGGGGNAPLASAPVEKGHDRAAMPTSDALRDKLFNSDHVLKEEIMAFSADCLRRGLAPGEGVVVLITSDADFLRPAAQARQIFDVRVESVHFAPCASRMVAEGGFAQWTCEFRDLLDAYAPLSPEHQQQLRNAGVAAAPSSSSSPFPMRRRPWTFPYPPHQLSAWFERQGWGKLLKDWEQRAAATPAPITKGGGEEAAVGGDGGDGVDAASSEGGSDSGSDGSSSDSDSDSDSWSSTGRGSCGEPVAPEILLRRAERLEAKAAALRRLAERRQRWRLAERRSWEQVERGGGRKEAGLADPQEQEQKQGGDAAAAAAAAPPPPSSSLIFLALQRRSGGGGSSGGGGVSAAVAAAANGGGVVGVVGGNGGGKAPPVRRYIAVPGPDPPHAAPLIPRRVSPTTVSAAVNTLNPAAPAPNGDGDNNDARRRAAVASAVAAIARDVPAAYARDPDFRRGTPFVVQHGLVRSDEEGMRGWYRHGRLAVPRGGGGGGEDDDSDNGDGNALRRRVLAICHETAGHPGAERTAEVVAAGWWWPNVEEDAERFVRFECGECRAVGAGFRVWGRGHC